MKLHKKIVKYTVLGTRRLLFEYCLQVRFNYLFGNESL